ncbi:MAG: hypothetical protein IJK68_06675 [Muribaculaceae bacterium]|nr:hypothetical protein [Muribaculaceae bacterium]MBR0025117.1 hypothetical protein [Muribaculaceae bacterium]
MPKSKQTTPVDDNETLLRAIFSPSFFDEDGFLSPSAFELQIQSKSGEPETGISVIRPAIKGHKKFLKWLEDNPREKTDDYCGTVELIAKIVRNIKLKTTKDIQIEIVPTSSNYHAEIKLYIEGNLIQAGCCEPEYLSFLRHLVNMVQDQIKRTA